MIIQNDFDLNISAQSGMLQHPQRIIDFFLVSNIVSHYEYCNFKTACDSDSPMRSIEKSSADYYHFISTLD